VSGPARLRELLAIAVLLLIPLGALAAVATVVAAVVITLTGAAGSHPLLGRFRDVVFLTVLALVALGLAAVLAHEYARLWRLRLRGITRWGTVVEARLDEASDPDLSDRHYASVDVDGTTVDVAVHRAHVVGERVRVRYDTEDHKNAVQVRRSVGDGITTALVDAVFIGFLGSIGYGVVLLVAAAVHSG
jgi:hypothetical protein